VPMLSFGGDLVQPWPASDVLEILSTLQNQYHLLSAPPLDQIDESMTMPWHGMASSCHRPHLSPATCSTMSHHSLSLPCICSCTPLTEKTSTLARNPHAPTRPRRPERARTCPWTRQDAAVPRRLSAPLDLSFPLQPHLDVSYLTDNAAWTHTPCRRRHRRRPSATVRRYTGTCRLLLTTPDLAWMRVVITVTPGTHLAHSLPLQRPGTATPPSTCPLRLGLASPL
jgi:hypothetical protein